MICGMKSTERDVPGNRLRSPAPALVFRCVTHHRRHWCCGYGDESHAPTLRGLGSQDVPEESRAARRGPARVSQATGRPRPPSLAPWPGACVDFARIAVMVELWRTVDVVAAQGQGIAAFQASAPAGGESPTSPGFRLRLARLPPLSAAD